MVIGDDKVNEKKTIAIIVTYNRKQLLLECIESLFNQTEKYTLSILVIDNASTDGTFDLIQGLINEKKIEYINTGQNLGGAGGFEFGVLEAASRNYDFVWIMDDDTIPSSTALESFYRQVDLDNNFGFLSSYAQWTDGSTCTMNVQRINIFRRLKSFDAELIPVQFATFVSIFIPITVIREVGVPIGEFFIWGDDWEYTRRISKKYPSYFLKKSIVTHKTLHNNGCNLSNDIEARLPRYELYFRNIFYVAKKEGIKGIIYWCLNFTKNLFRVIFFSKNMKFKRICIMFRGLKRGLTFNPPIKKVEMN